MRLNAGKCRQAGTTLHELKTADGATCQAITLPNGKLVAFRRGLGLVDKSWDWILKSFRFVS